MTFLTKWFFAFITFEVDSKTSLISLVSNASFLRSVIGLYAIFTQTNDGTIHTCKCSSLYEYVSVFMESVCIIDYN